MSTDTPTADERDIAAEVVAEFHGQVIEGDTMAELVVSVATALAHVRFYGSGQEPA